MQAAIEAEGVAERYGALVALENLTIAPCSACWRAGLIWREDGAN